MKTLSRTWKNAQDVEVKSRGEHCTEGDVDLHRAETGKGEACPGDC